MHLLGLCSLNAAHFTTCIQRFAIIMPLKILLSAIFQLSAAPRLGSNRYHLRLIRLYKTLSKRSNIRMKGNTSPELSLSTPPPKTCRDQSVTSIPHVNISIKPTIKMRKSTVCVLLFALLIFGLIPSSSSTLRVYRRRKGQKRTSMPLEAVQIPREGKRGKRKLKY